MNCNTCESKYVPGRMRTPRPRPCPYKDGEPIPNFKPTVQDCMCKPAKITLRTVTIPANLGTDAEGQPYAPAPGTYFDAIVVYLSNNAVYIYDSNGQPTEVQPGDYDQLTEQIETFKQAINELYNPGKIGAMVQTEADVVNVDPASIAADEYVYVVGDSTHNNRPTLWQYSPSAGEFVYVMAASPYYEKPFIDSVVQALQANINNVMNKEVEDVENLQTNINAEVNAREAAVTELEQRIEDIVNSPDVRYIVDTYADLEAIDKTIVGDQDYARVLQDETHEDASTYYQFNKTENEWTYVGQTGPYYTKEQVDEKFEQIDTVKLDSLLEIKSLNDSLSLSEDGELSVVSGGGSSVNLLTAYTASPTTEDAYAASYINAELDAQNVLLGSGTRLLGGGTSSNNGTVGIGRLATTYFDTTWGGAVAVGADAKSPACGAIAIGSSAHAGSGADPRAEDPQARYCIAIGTNATASTTTASTLGAPIGAIAIGGGTTVTHNNSVALGAQASTNRAFEVSFGKKASSVTSATTRYLANVRAGELDTDAVNVAQLNAALARIEALEAEVAALKG